MRLMVLAPELPSGALAEQLAELVRRGHDVTVGLTDRRPPAPGDLHGARVLSVEDALRDECDVALATTWDSTVRLFEAQATRYAFRVDGFGHHRLGAWQAERIAAALAYDLPVDFIATAPWVQRVLEEHRPDARMLVAREPAPPAVEPAPAGAQLKVATDDEDFTGADVYVFTNAVDGVLGRPLHAMRAGAVPIVLPAGGQEDLITHLENGIVATPEDDRGVERWIERLDADRELLARLKQAARDTPWPDASEAGDELEQALLGILGTEPPPQTHWPTRLMADAMAGVAVYRNDHYVLSGELKRLQEDEAYKAAQRARVIWQHNPKLVPVRRLAKPLVKRAKNRLTK